MSPFSIARMLWKRKTLIVALWLLLSAVTGFVVWRLPSVYSSEAVILVDSQKIPDKYVTSTVSTDLQDRLATLNQQILSATRLKKVIDDLDLYHDERQTHVEEEIIEMMRKDIAVKVERGWIANRPGAFRIVYQGQNPGVVAQVANRIAGFYIEENMKTREIQAAGTSDFIESQLQQAKKGLDDLEAAVSAYKLKHNGELPQQENSIAGNLARLQVELEASRDAMNRAQQTKVLLEGTLSAAETDLSAHQSAFRALISQGANDAGVENVLAPGQMPRPKRESEALEERLDILRLQFTEDFPEVKQLEALVARIKQREDSAASSAHGSLAPAPLARAPKQTVAATANLPEPGELVRTRERVELLHTQLALTANEIESRTREQERVIASIHSYQSRMETLPVREQEMAQLTRDYEISKSNYKSLLDKKISAEMATDMERRQKSERFTMLDSARIPEKPLKPNRPMLAGGGTGAALLLSLAIAFVLEKRKGLFLGEWELPPQTVVLGRLPEIQFSAVGRAKAVPERRQRHWFGRKLTRVAAQASRTS
ncbi:MAG TPA: Wzz/FepE/Etk N-terminal domain-containing protein [Candidatus Acidoferrales bacterium]|nr:Wzz/FepE/Etk N-terminal domain-containing protein [Candidatus Acidoferrales bacterium]